LIHSHISPSVYSMALHGGLHRVRVGITKLGCKPCLATLQCRSEGKMELTCITTYITYIYIYIILYYIILYYIIYIIIYTLRISQNHSDGNQLQYSNTTTEPICPCNVKSQRNELLSCWVAATWLQCRSTSWKRWSIAATCSANDCPSFDLASRRSAPHLFTLWISLGTRHGQDSFKVWTIGLRMIAGMWVKTCENCHL